LNDKIAYIISRHNFKYIANHYGLGEYWKLSRNMLADEAAGREDEHGRGEECSGETISIRVFGA
jgi:dsRNA-specific ribonuclease